jgi:hypothetical protein
MNTEHDVNFCPLPQTFAFSSKADRDSATINASSAVDNGWSVVSAAELAAKPLQRPPELIHRLLYRGGTMLMSGASKSMKTFTMIDVGLSVATGREWLGFKCKATPVLLLNLELQDFAMADRVSAVSRAARIDPPESFFVVNLRGQLVNVDTIESKLARMIETTKAGLVIIDPHYKIGAASNVEENSNDAQGLLLYRLENTVCRSGAALILAHHFSKGDKSQTKAIDRAAGGGALARWPDVVMTLTDHAEPDCATVEFSLRNFAPVPPFVVRWKYPIWTQDETLDPSLLKKTGRSDEHPASELLKKLRDGMTNKEWRDASGWTDGTFRRKRNELISSGKIREASGVYYVKTPEQSQSPESF